MGIRLQLSDTQWARIEAFLEADYTVGEPGHDDRNFIEAVLWWRRTGAPWRDLPAAFGPWKTRCCPVSPPSEAGFANPCATVPRAFSPGA